MGYLPPGLRLPTLSWSSALTFTGRNLKLAPRVSFECRPAMNSFIVGYPFWQAPSEKRSSDRFLDKSRGCASSACMDPGGSGPGHPGSLP